MAVDVPQTSRLRFTELLSLGGVEFWDLLDLPTVPEQPDDVQHQVVSTDRLDLLASSFYGNPIFWWVIAVANDFDLIDVDLNVGAFLRIPSPRYVRDNLFASTKV